jgi:hypothetical protein
VMMNFGNKKKHAALILHELKKLTVMRSLNV